MPAGRLAEGWGARRTTLAGAALSGAALCAVALLVRSWVPLLGVLVVAGVGNALAQIGSNLALAEHVPRARQGLAFGVKQAAIPTATMLGGLAVPLLGLTVGWRWAFAAGALGAPLYAVVVGSDGLARTPPTPALRSPAPRNPLAANSTSRRPDTDTDTRSLVVLACGVGLGAAAANSFGAFLVESAVAGGIAPGPAGLIFALGSVLGIAARLLAGWSADRREGGHLPVVAAQQVSGSVGLGLLAGAGLVDGDGAVTALVVLGTLLGFGLGWSWPGLFNFAVVRLNRGAPAAATSITQSGIFAGGALGPLAFGATVEATSYTVAWTGAAVALVLAAGLVLLGRRLVLAGLAGGARPRS